MTKANTTNYKADLTKVTQTIKADLTKKYLGK